MRLRLLLSLSLLLCAWQNAWAQMIPADDFFHGGAISYLSNNIPHALEVVTNGLKFYPNDAKLKKLEELLKQQNQQQQQKQQDQKQEQQQNNQSDKNQNNQKKSDEEKKPEEQKKDAQKTEPKDQDAPKPDEGDKKNPKPEDQQEARAGEMTPQEAKQLLDAQKNDEKLVPVARQDKPPQRKLVKDW